MFFKKEPDCGSVPAGAELQCPSPELPHNLLVLLPARSIISMCLLRHRLEHPQKGSLSSAVVYPAFPPSLFVLAVCHAVLKYLAGTFSNISLCHLEQTFPQLWAWVPHLVSCLCSINRAENPICCSFRRESIPARLNKKNKQPENHWKTKPVRVFHRVHLACSNQLSASPLLLAQGSDPSSHKQVFQPCKIPGIWHPVHTPKEKNVCSSFREIQFMSLITSLITQLHPYRVLTADKAKHLF